MFLVYVIFINFIIADRGANVINKPNTLAKETEESMLDDTADDCAPLFYCPGKAGFYSPRQGRATFERLNAFRNVGRLVKYQNTYLPYSFCHFRIFLPTALTATGYIFSVLSG